MEKRISIPSEVKKELRSEVGFGCPVKGCGNPYLEYHHFDPPVNIKPHNDPKGMIALCAHHHKKADGGAYTVEQLHALKNDKANASLVKGNLDWLRRKLLAVVGGNFFYETLRIINIDGTDVISLIRDGDGYLRLSIKMMSREPEERIIIDKNSWENIGTPLDLRSPPQGKELEVKYSNGDYLYVKFIELDNLREAVNRYKSNIFNGIEFPITAVEVNMTIANTNIELTPTHSHVSGNMLAGNLFSNCGGGILIDNTGIKWSQNPYWNLNNRIEETEHPNVIKVRFGK